LPPQPPTVISPIPPVILPSETFRESFTLEVSEDFNIRFLEVADEVLEHAKELNGNLTMEFVVNISSEDGPNSAQMRVILENLKALGFKVHNR